MRVLAIQAQWSAGSVSGSLSQISWGTPTAWVGGAAQRRDLPAPRRGLGRLGLSEGGMVQ